MSNVDNQLSDKLCTELKDEGNDSAPGAHEQSPKHVEESSEIDGIVQDFGMLGEVGVLEGVVTPVEDSDVWDLPAKKVKKKKHRSASIWE